MVLMILFVPRSSSLEFRESDSVDACLARLVDWHGIVCFYRMCSPVVWWALFCLSCVMEFEVFGCLIGVLGGLGRRVTGVRWYEIIKCARDCRA